MGNGMSNRVAMITLLLGLLTWMGLASADYFMVEPTGKMIPAEKVDGIFRPISGTEEDFLTVVFDKQYYDTLSYYTYGGHYFYPNRDSNTIFITWFTPQYVCSLAALGGVFYSDGYAQAFVWEAPDYIKDTPTDSVLEYLYETWEYDSVANQWVLQPDILAGPLTIGSEGLGDWTTRYCLVEFDPKIDIKWNSFYAGYMITDRMNPNPLPYGGKPWPTSDGAYEDGILEFIPSRSYMYRVQPGHPDHCKWIPYSNITGNWIMFAVINIYDIFLVDIRVNRLRDTYLKGSRTVTARLVGGHGEPFLTSRISSISLIYWINSETPDTLAMSLICEDSSIYSADIPGQAAWDTVSYYVYAQDIHGPARSSSTYNYVIRKGTHGGILLVIEKDEWCVPAHSYGLPYSYDPVGAVYPYVDYWYVGNYGKPDSSVLNFYHKGPGENTVIWVTRTGSLFWEDTTFLKDFLDSGGNLFLSSQALFGPFGPWGTVYWVAPPGHFAYEYLKVRAGYEDYFTAEDTTFTLYGVEGNPLTSELTEIVVYPPGYDLAGKFDSLAPECSPIFYDTAGAIMGYCYEGDYKLVCLYWLFQYIGDRKDTVIIGEDTVFADTSSQKTLVRNILKWFGVVGIEEVTSPAVNTYSLGQNVPNPTSSVTSISYTLPKSSNVSLKIYDITGRLVKTLVDQKVEAGNHIVCWDTKGDLGFTVTNGVYFCRLQAGDFSSMRKVIILR
jgi:hypothetical protein